MKGEIIMEFGKGRLGLKVEITEPKYWYDKIGDIFEVWESPDCESHYLLESNRPSTMGLVIDKDCCKIIWDEEFELIEAKNERDILKVKVEKLEKDKELVKKMMTFGEGVKEIKYSTIALMQTRVEELESELEADHASSEEIIDDLTIDYNQMCEEVEQLKQDANKWNYLKDQLINSNLTLGRMFLTGFEHLDIDDFEYQQKLDLERSEIK
jgi:hypothetical protein